MEQLQATFGIAAGLLSDPRFGAELTSVLTGIIRDKVTDPTLMLARLQETDWFQRHTSQWQAIEKDRLAKDPALWEAAVRERAEVVREQFAAAGAEIDDATATKYATQLIYGSGWEGESFEIYDENWLRETVASAIDFDKTKTVNGVLVADLRGQAATKAQELYALAHEYGLESSMTDKAFSDWFKRTLRGALDGSLTDDQLDDELVEQASSRFPGLAPALQRGMSLRTAANPYLRAISDTLEIDVDQVDLNDNLVQQILNGTGVDGDFKPMNLYQAKLAARKDDRWKYTETARREYTDMASRILADFGFGG